MAQDRERLAEHVYERNHDQYVMFTCQLAYAPCLECRGSQGLFYQYRYAALDPLTGELIMAMRSRRNEDAVNARPRHRRRITAPLTRTKCVLDRLCRDNRIQGYARHVGNSACVALRPRASTYQSHTRRSPHLLEPDLAIVCASVITRPCSLTRENKVLLRSGMGRQ